MSGESTRLAVRAREGQHGDPGRADGLHERERREAQRGDVDEPACRLGREAHHPAAVAEEQRHEAERPLRREGRHAGGRVVLPRVRPVDGQSGDEREDEADRDLHRSP